MPSRQYTKSGRKKCKRGGLLLLRNEERKEYDDARMTVFFQRESRDTRAGSRRVASAALIKERQRSARGNAR